MITLIEIIVSAVTGAIASLIAPWANWGIEKRKKLLEWRKGFINKCKDIINKYDFSPDMFRETSYYSSLKPNLSKRLQEEVEEKRYSPGKLMNREQRVNFLMKEFKVKKNLLNEIAIIEKEWGLL